MKRAGCIVTVVFAAALGSLLVAGCSSPPPPPASITGTEFKGTIWSPRLNDVSIASQDGGQSFAVPGGTLWTFGDTLLGKRDADGLPDFRGGSLFSSIAFLPESDKSFPPALRYKTGPDGVAASPLSLLPGETAGTYLLWPLGGIHTGGKSYLYYHVIQKTGGGSWDFQGIGSGLAASEQPLGDYRRLHPSDNWQFPVAPAQVIEYGDWLYLYEIVTQKEKGAVALARVKAAEIASPDAYEFYSLPEKRFVPDKSAESAILPAAGQVSVAFNSYCNGWLMATSSDVADPRSILLFLAPAPEGPWRSIGAIKVPETRQGKKVQLVYCAYLHPELFRDGGKTIALTFSVYLGDGHFGANPELVEATLELGPGKNAAD